MDVSLKDPFWMLVSGGRGVGKTEFTNKLLQCRLIALPLERIVWCYAEHQQDLFEELMKMNVEYKEGIPGELDKHFKKNKRNLIILDDLMNLEEASKSLKVTQLFTCGCHGNLSVIYLTQNLFRKNQHLVTKINALSLNSDYMMIFKNLRENSQFATIARQIRSDKVKLLMWAYIMMQHHLRIPVWCLIWNQTLRKGFQCEARFWKICNRSV